MKITFLGLGIMGSRMAKNLLKNQIDLTVYNRSPQPVQELASLGANTANSFSDAASGADIVFTMLAKPDVVEEVMFGADGCLPAMQTNALWVDCSTVNPSFSRRAAKEAEQNGLRFLDAPVAGTKPHAAKAELTFFVGGSAADLEQARPYIDYMGKKVMHLGAHGMGSSFKMLVNGMLAQSMLMFSETVVLGEKMGISRDFLLDNLPKLPVAAPFTNAKAELIREGNYEEQFPLEWMHKDLKLLLTTAEEQGQDLHLAKVAEAIFQHAKDEGLAREDFSAVHKVIEQ